MAHFYADIQGNRGQATRMGTKGSGINGHIRGWNLGVKVWMDYDEKNDCDVCDVWLTSGSNGHRSGKYLGTFTAKDLEITAPCSQKED